MSVFTDPIHIHEITWRGVKISWWYDHSMNYWYGNVAGHDLGPRMGLKPIIQDGAWYIDGNPKLKDRTEQATLEEKELYNKYTKADSGVPSPILRQTDAEAEWGD